MVIAGDILPDDIDPTYYKKFIDPVGTTRIMRQGWWFENVFVPWLTEVKHIKPEDRAGEWSRRFQSIILVGGNHDFFFNAMLPSGIQKKLPNNVHYLHEKHLLLDGVKFFGAGWNMTRGWAFCKDEEDHAEALRYVADDVDVMIVHGPPFHKDIDVLHVHYCSAATTTWLIDHPNVKHYICGHIHEAYGQYNLGPTKIHVVSRKDRMYRDVNPFVEIEIEKGVVV